MKYIQIYEKTLKYSLKSYYPLGLLNLIELLLLL
jgi:hypothetical protein